MKEVMGNVTAAAVDAEEAGVVASGCGMLGDKMLGEVKIKVLEEHNNSGVGDGMEGGGGIAARLFGLEKPLTEKIRPPTMTVFLKTHCSSTPIPPYG